MHEFAQRELRLFQLRLAFVEDFLCSREISVVEKLASKTSRLESRFQRAGGQRARQLEIFDAEVERFVNAQPAGIEQVDNQTRGIAMQVASGGEELGDLSRGRSFSDDGRASGAQSVDGA